jgi:hypothetical protein
MNKSKVLIGVIDVWRIQPISATLPFKKYFTIFISFIFENGITLTLPSRIIVGKGA